MWHQSSGHNVGAHWRSTGGCGALGASGLDKGHLANCCPPATFDYPRPALCTVSCFSLIVGAGRTGMHRAVLLVCVYRCQADFEYMRMTGKLCYALGVMLVPWSRLADDDPGGSRRCRAQYCATACKCPTCRHKCSRHRQPLQSTEYRVTHHNSANTALSSTQSLSPQYQI